MKIKQKEKENLALMKTNFVLLHKIDSLEKVKRNITLVYDKKIDNIFDASAYDHASWLESTVKELNRSKIR